MEKWLDVGAAVLALAAAVFWFLSAYGKLPPLVSLLGPRAQINDCEATFAFLLPNAVLLPAGRPVIRSR